MGDASDDEYIPVGKAARQSSSMSWEVSTEAATEVLSRRSNRLESTHTMGRPKEWKDSPTTMKAEGEINAEGKCTAQEVASKRSRLSWDSGWSSDEEGVIVERRTIGQEENHPGIRGFQPLTTKTIPACSHAASTTLSPNKKRIAIPTTDIRLSKNVDVRHFLMLVEAHMCGRPVLLDEHASNILRCFTLVQGNRVPWTETDAHQYVRLLLKGQVEDATRIAAATATQQISTNVSGARSSTVTEDPDAISDAPQQSSVAGSHQQKNQENETTTFAKSQAQQLEKHYYNSLISKRATDYKNGNEELKVAIVDSIWKEYKIKKGSDGTLLTAEESLERIEKDLVIECVSCRHCATLPVVSLRAQKYKSTEYKLYRRTVRDSVFKYRYGDEAARNVLVEEISDQFIFQKQERILSPEEKVKKVETALVAELTRVPRARKRLMDPVLEDRKERKSQKPNNEQAVETKAAAESKLVNPLFLDSPYVEEISYHAYSGVNRAVDKMPPPEEFNPVFPSDPSVSWRYDPATRVVLADFSKTKTPSEEHVQMLLLLMERDDIAVISEGLHASLSGEQEKNDFLKYLESTFRNTDAPYHKFRRFNRNETNGKVFYGEVDGHVQMTIPVYLSYLELHKKSPTFEGNCRISFHDSFGKMHAVDARVVVFYMVDADMPRYFYKLNQQYKNSFKVPQVLVGSDCCLLGSVPEQSRPLMGPNLYVTPGGGFTSLHQDGFGTVDSGHSCLAGYNEVVMLRRLPEIHKKRACSIVPSLYGEVDGEVAAENTMFRMPHDDGREDKPLWPTKKVVDEWTSLKMYLGASAEGINRETATTIESARLCRQHGAKSLAIVESTVMSVASTIKSSPTPFEKTASKNSREIAAGILPSIRYLISKESSKREGFGELDDEPGLTTGVELKLADVPDSFQDPQTHPIDPFGNDYFCKTCSHELSNVYYHCDGCEAMLGQDFNICSDCYYEGRFLRTYRMREYGEMTSNNHHLGGTTESVQSRRCKCHAGVCKRCGKGTCKKCSCKCHKKFTRRLRFRTIEAGFRLLKDCEDVAAGKEVQFSAETLARLNRTPMELPYPMQRLGPNEADV